MARFVRNANKLFGRQMIICQNYFIVYKNKNKYNARTIIYRHAYVSQKVFNGTIII